MKGYDNTDTLVGLVMLGVYFTVFALGIAGWILNIVAIAHANGVMTGLLIVRIAGVFIPPLGAFLGWFF